MDANGIEASEVVPASRKLAKREAADLAKKASKIVVAKGKQVREFAGGKAGKDVIEAMLGPTGNLRAPCLVAGKTVVVGFNDEVYTQVFG